MLKRKELQALEAKAEAGTLNDLERIKLTAYFTSKMNESTEEKKRPLAFMTYVVGSAATVKDVVTKTVNEIKVRGEMARLESHERTISEVEQALACLPIQLKNREISQKEHDAEFERLSEALEAMQEELEATS